MQEELRPGLENMKNFLDINFIQKKVIHVFKAWP